MFEELFILFNCKFLVITSQNLDLDPDSQKAWVWMRNEDVKMPTTLKVNHVYVWNQSRYT